MEDKRLNVPVRTGLREAALAIPSFQVVIRNLLRSINPQLTTLGPLLRPTLGEDPLITSSTRLTQPGAT